MKLNEIAKQIKYIPRTPVEPNQINLKSFDYKKSLNTKIWDKNTGKLQLNVRKRLIKIAKEFIDSTGIDFMPVDIIVVGSISSYNWSKYSDIDLHIVADMSAINPNTELVKNYMYSKKCEWNETHSNLKIYGYDVELYVQDIGDENESNGVFSIKYNHWVKIPSYEHKEIDKNTVKDLAALYMNKIDYYDRKFDELSSDKSFILLQSKVNYLYDLIIKGRKKSLAAEGEQASGNIIFKVLRRSGHLEELHDLKNRLFDKINSIEESYAVDDDKLIIE